jgi:hypothetical protein
MYMMITTAIWHVPRPRNRNFTGREAELAAVRGWLETHPGWLLVLDNATEPFNLTDHLPQDGPGHVLVTSRTSA